jgi:hypothetical protein
VFNGQSRLIELGFRQGGPAGWRFCALQACDAREDVCEIGLRIEAIEFAGLDE